MPGKGGSAAPRERLLPRAEEVLRGNPVKQAEARDEIAGLKRGRKRANSCC